MKSFFTMSGFTLLSRLSGFARDMAIAAVLGAGTMADVFFVALRFPNLFRRIFAEGAFSASFVPIFSAVLATEGKEKAKEFAERAFSVLLFSLLAFSIFLIILMPEVMHLITPGFVKDKEKFELAVLLTQVTFPYLFFISLASLYTGILNSIDRFAVGAAAPVLLNVCCIIALLFFADVMETPAHSLSLAVSISGFLQLLWLFFDAKKVGFALRVKLPKLTRDVKKFLKKMMPGILGAGVIQINLFIDTIIASFIAEGSISYLYYADRVNQLPLSLIGTAMGVALLPMLARQISEKKMDEVITTQNRALEFVLFLCLPCTIALILLANTITIVLFERGQFEADNALATAYALIAFAVGLPAFVMTKIFTTSFFADGDTSTPVRLSIICLITNTVLNIAFIYLFPAMGFMPHIGIALATSLSSWLNVFMLAKILFRHEKFKFDDKIKHRVPRIIFATLIMGFVIFVIQMQLHSWIMAGEIKRIMAFLVIAGAGGISFFATTHFTGAYDLRELKRLVKRRKKV